MGYTNAGKSTLFNTVTRSSVVALDQLFATLDPTMRQSRLPSGRTIILSDTVGFVSDLPHELVAAFRATLEEVLEADIIVHVRDIAHPETKEQKQDVEDVLLQLGIEVDHVIPAEPQMQKSSGIVPSASDRGPEQDRPSRHRRTGGRPRRGWAPYGPDSYVGR